MASRGGHSLLYHCKEDSKTIIKAFKCESSKLVIVAAEVPAAFHRESIAILRLKLVPPGIPAGMFVCRRRCDRSDCDRIICP